MRQLDNSTDCISIRQFAAACYTLLVLHASLQHAESAHYQFLLAIILDLQHPTFRYFLQQTVVWATINRGSALMHQLLPSLLAVLHPTFTFVSSSHPIRSKYHTESTSALEHLRKL